MRDLSVLDIDRVPQVCSKGIVTAVLDYYDTLLYAEDDINGIEAWFTEYLASDTFSALSPNQKKEAYSNHKQLLDFLDFIAEIIHNINGSIIR